MLDGEYVYLRSPGVTSGVTKMLVAGDGVEVSYDEVTYSLGANGGQPGSTDARAFLVKFQQGKVYRFRVTGTACVVIGQDVDRLSDSSSKFSEIVNLVNVCSVDANNRVSAVDQTALANVTAAKELLDIKQRYSYYVLTNEVYRSTAVDVE